MSQPVTRRQFLGTSSRTAAGVAAGLSVSTMLRDARAAEANAKFGVALIGCGGMGRFDLRDFMRAPETDVIAVCDVDDKRLKDAADEVEKKGRKRPMEVKDYRKIIDMKEVNAVIVGTPDHWHAIPMILACQAGKDVYVEKPCCHNIKEGRAMVDAAKKFNRVTQVGTQQRSGKHFQDAVEYVRSGKLGTITMTETYTYGNESPNGMGNVPDEDNPPAGVDYEMWLGPAPKRKFNKNRFHGSFRWFFDYAAGMVGDWNVHLQDIIVWAMGGAAPVSVTTVGGVFILKDGRDTPDTMITTYQYPNNFVHKYTMRKCSGKPWDRGGYGMIFHGTNGKLFVNRQYWQVEPDTDLIKDPNDPSKRTEKARVEAFKSEDAPEHEEQHWPHVQNFIECMKTRKPCICNVEEHYKTVVACHLANVSYRAGRQLFWDPKQEACFYDMDHRIPIAQANAFLSREYRKGYELPKV